MNSIKKLLLTIGALLVFALMLTLIVDTARANDKFEYIEPKVIRTPGMAVPDEIVINDDVVIKPVVVCSNSCATYYEKWTVFNDGNLCTTTCYCLCRKCCGAGYKKNLTASGVAPTRYISCANGSLPFGTVVYIEGIGYRTVHDRGSAVGPTHFDIYVGIDNHAYASSYGMQKRKVWIVEGVTLDE